MLLLSCCPPVTRRRSIVRGANERTHKFNSPIPITQVGLFTYLILLPSLMRVNHYFRSRAQRLNAEKYSEGFRPMNKL